MGTSTKLTLVLVWLFVFGAFAPRMAQADDPTLGEEMAVVTPRPLDKAAALALAKTVTPEAYPDSDDALIDNLITEYYKADGTGEAWDDSYTKILTERGKKKNRTMSLGFRLPYSVAEVGVLELIKPDGKTVPVDVKAQSKVMISSGQMSANIYDPNHKTLQVNIPDLEVGDVIHCLSHRTTMKTIMPNTWADIELFEYTSFIKRLAFELHAPKDLPLRQLKLRAEVTGTITHKKEEKPDGSVVYRWEAKDVPRMFEEPGMPSLDDVVQRLLASTIPDWQTISRWYWELSKPRLDAVTPEMKEKVTELTQGAADDLAKAKAVFFFVAQKIRYMGITTEKEAPGYEPHDVKITFENKYGVCRDKAALLVAMLRLAGLQAYPVLINAGPKKDPEVPQPFFNHAIAAVELKPGEYTLMDPTDENTKELLPSYLCNMSYLVAKPTGETILTTPVIPVALNMIHVATEGSLDENGGLRACSEIRYEGINDNYIRYVFSRKTPEERRRWFESGLKNSIPAARLTGFSFSPENVFDTSATFSVALEFETEDVLVNGGGFSLLDAPWIGGPAGWLGANVLQEAFLEKRKYPLIIESTFGKKETVKLHLGKAVGETVSMPTFDGVSDPCILFAMGMSRDGGTFESSSEFLLKTVEFSPEEYLNLKKALRTLEFDIKKAPLFKKAKKGAGKAGSEESGVQILDDRKEIVIHDAHSFTFTQKLKKKVIDYRGKKRESELKLHYNPTWEEVSLVSASVTHPDGTRKEVIKEEINVMDASWSGSAPRYPGGKILVASLPGVEVGSVIEVETVRKATARPFVSACEFFRDSNPIVKRTVVYSYPKNLDVKIVRRNWTGVAEKTSEADDRVTIEWTVENQPASVDESNMPPRWMFVPTALVSAGDWKAYGTELNGLLEKAAASQPETARKAELLVKGATQRDFIRAVRDFVAKNVRNAGPAYHELPLSAITPADKTLADGYGNAADRAVLLFSLLKAGGLAPKYMLVSHDPDIETVVAPPVDAPQRFLFGNVLVKILCENEAIYLNDTDQYAEVGTTNAEGRLELNPATGLLGKVTAPPGKESRTELAFDVKVSATGSAVIKRIKRSYGTFFAHDKRQYDEMTPEERRRHFLGMVAGLSQSAKAVGTLNTKFDAYPGVEEFTVEIPNYAVVDGQRLYFTLPFGIKGFFSPDSDSRENPMLWSNRVDSRYEMTVQLPEGFDKVLIAPSVIDFNIPGDLGKISVHPVKPVDGKSPWKINGSLRLTEGLISPELYKDLLHLDDLIALKNANLFLLEK